MKYTHDKHRLTITVNKTEQKSLQRAMKKDEDFHSDQFLHDLFEQMVCNSELMWIQPAWVGALTDAPMLGFIDEEIPITPDMTDQAFYFCAGAYPDKKGVHRTWYHPVREAWAFMDYQICSVQERLANTGKAVFISGE